MVGFGPTTAKTRTQKILGVVVLLAILGSFIYFAVRSLFLE